MANDMDEMIISASSDVPSMQDYDSNGIFKKGYMKKQGKHVKSWKNRYFKLTNNGIMSYYETENDRDPLGSFSCRHLTKLSYKSWNKKQFGLKVYTPHRNWKLLLSNDEERKEWHAAITSVSRLKSGQE